MIVHSSADKKFYEAFYEMFYKSIRTNQDDLKLSFNYIGHDFNDLDLNLTNINTCTEISFQEIKEKYKVTDDRTATGFYALNRWTTIPVEENQDVCVCDIDLLMVNPISQEICKDVFKTNEAINITRIKPNGKEGGMMVMILRHDICQMVRDYAIDTLRNNPLRWDLDVEVRTFIYSNFNVQNILKMQNVTKKPYRTSDDWFVFSKTNEFDRLNTVYKDRFLGEEL